MKELKKVSSMINNTEELIDILKRQYTTILKFEEVASQLGIILTDFQLGQIESLKYTTKLAIEQVNELNETLKGE